MIDGQKKLSCKEYIILYYVYYKTKYGSYPDGIDETIYCTEFKPDEALINRSNELSKEEKAELLSVFRQDIDNLNVFAEHYSAEPQKYELPIIWNDRKHTEYFDSQLTSSHQFELFISSKFKEKGYDIGMYYSRDGQYSGENQAGVEIKNDKKMHETGNVYIEYMERMSSDGEWVQSGILKDDNTRLWAIGTEDDYILIKKSDLIYLFNHLIEKNREGCYDNGYRFVEENEHQTSKGFIVKRKYIKKYLLDLDQAIDFLKNKS